MGSSEEAMMLAAAPKSISARAAFLVLERLAVSFRNDYGLFLAGHWCAGENWSTSGWVRLVGKGWGSLNLI